jgi:putative membrane protein insertion efficiency factor
MIDKLEIILIKTYQTITHPVYHALDKVHLNIFRCRYTPSCSEYTIEAIKKYGPFKGAIKGIQRISRCCPPYGGHDPLE